MAKSKFYSVKVQTEIIVSAKNKKELDKIVAELQEPCHYEHGRSFGSTVSEVVSLTHDVVISKFPPNERPINVKARAKEYWNGDVSALLRDELMS